MTIIYCTSGAWGAGAGRLLHDYEVDGNFWDHQQRITTLETEVAAGGVHIIEFSVVGDQFYVHMSDSTTLGPYTLPELRWVFKGAWLPLTAYAINDVVTANGSVYIVLIAHTSAATFDPGA